ncbi:MAG: hypothetical protein ACUVXF_06255 [Desulfobaccales bacterium]
MAGVWKQQWTGWLALGVVFLLAGGEVPLRADGTLRKVSRDSDSLQFREEFRSRGAYKFYDDTEDILRSGNFELALGRYLFLAAQIRGQSIYAGLNASTNQRLSFLRAQMGLGEQPLRVSKPLKRRLRRVSQAKPTSTEKKAAPEDKTEGQSSDKPGGIIIPPTVPGERKTEPPAAEPKPSAPEVKPSPAEEKPEKPEAAEDLPPPPPPPPPSAWEKIKRRLKFW